MENLHEYDGPLSKLHVWNLAIKYCSKYLPLIDSIKSKVLKDQLSRSLISISSNIAEGYGRYTSGDYARFLRIAIGSTFEAETQLIIALNIGYLKSDAKNALSELKEIRIKLFALHRAIQKRKSLKGDY